MYVEPSLLLQKAHMHFVCEACSIVHVVGSICMAADLNVLV